MINQLEEQAMTYEPFSRDEKRRLLWVSWHYRSALLQAHRSPLAREEWRRHTSPQPGDWVFEVSTAYGLLVAGSRFDESLWDGQITRFLRSDVRVHPPVEDDDEEQVERVLVCENPDGTEFVWTNAELAVVPLDGRLVER